MEMKYIPVHLGTHNVVVCPDCGSLVHSDYIGHHNAFHVRLLRGTLKK